MPASNAHDSHNQNSRKISRKASRARKTGNSIKPARGKAGGMPQTAQASRSKCQASKPGQPLPDLTFSGPAFSGQDWLLPILNGDRRICANCRHWDLHYKACLPRLEHGQLHFDIAAPCAVGAVAANAGDCVPMLGETGSCAGHADLFAPSDDYLNEMQERQEKSERQIFLT